MTKSLFTFLILYIITLAVQGQSLYNQGSIITISNNTPFLVPDSVVNNGEISNDGDLIVQGAWINNNVYNAGTGSITLASSTPQIINHNDQSLTQLTIAGGGDKIFEEDILVTDLLIMDNGLLLSANEAKIIVSENGSIQGASENSYIVGEVVHLGVGNKYYPVGTIDAFLPFELLEVAGQSPEIGVFANRDNPNNSVVGTLDEISNRWYWNMEVKSGVFAGSMVRLAINQESLSGTFEQSVIGESPDLQNAFHSLGQGDITGDFFDGTITSALQATGGLYAVGIDLSITEAKPEISVFNAVTPNGDNRHEFLKIENIDLYPGNQVVIYNKLGEKVFEIQDYNNFDNIFTGLSNTGGSETLPDGTYYYYIDKKDGSDAISGYFVLTK